MATDKDKGLVGRAADIVGGAARHRKGDHRRRLEERGSLALG
jgi:hypothetical protein